MATVKRPYGRWSRSMFAALRQQELLKVEAFVSWLAARGIRIDRTLVSHWSAGRSHLPADLLPLLAEFTKRPETVFGPFLNELGWRLVELPIGNPADNDLVNLILEAGAALGRLQRALCDARSPDSPGGVEITEGERAELRGCLDDLIQRLADLRSRLSHEQHDSPTC